MGAAILGLETRLGALTQATAIGAAHEGARKSLVAIAKSADADPSFDAEQALSHAEDQLVIAASKALGTTALAEIEVATREATAAYKSRMPANIYETLIGESVRRKTLQHFGLPRFLLTEIE